MDWVLNNLDNVIIPIIIMILYGMGSFAQKKGKKDQKAPPKQARQVDPDESRRVAQIQEEIRRKIAERTGRAVPPPPPKRASTPSVQSSKPTLESGNWTQPTQKNRQPERRAVPPPITSTPSTYQIDQQQRQIEAKLKQARELEASLKSKPTAKVWGASQRTNVAKGELRKMLFQDLANPLGQKKAILVGEILGTPVGVKGPSGWNSKV